MLPQARRSPHIRLATEPDMHAIHEWLVRQDREGVAGSFLCNWNLTLECQREAEVIVFVDEASHEPVAYQWGSLIQPGILEVRADKRGSGIGRILVEHRLADAHDRNEDILYIQCKPSSSIPFWQRMGFQLVDSGDGSQHAYRIMPRALELPSNGEAVRVEVQWHPEHRKWAPATTPMTTLAPDAARTPDGDIRFAERVHCLDRTQPGDLVLRVVVDGEEVYCDKAKYREAQELGVQPCRNGFYLDALLLS